MKKKADIAAKIAAKPLKYNLMVGYDPILETEISLTLKNDGKQARIATPTYIYMKDLRKEEAEHIAKLVKDINFKFTSPKTGNQKVYKVRYVSVTLAPNIAAGKLNRLNKKRVKGKTHSSGTNNTNYEKKLSKRVKKATLAIIRAEAKKLATAPKKAEIKGIQKPVQQKLNFKAAA